MSRTPFQRFIDELRRRHVPQTAAIYLVAAWAAIEFADVVVPNLNGPQWIVTAVIVAALAGFPVMLVVAWVFEWGPEGIHRTPDAAGQRMEAPPSYAPESGDVEPAPPARGPVAPDRAQPWLAAMAVLLVGIGGAVAVAYVVAGGDSTVADTGRPAAEAPEMGPATGSSGDARPTRDRVGDTVPPPPLPPHLRMDVPGPGFADSIQQEIRRAFEAFESLDMEQLQAIGQRAAARVAAGNALGLVIGSPAEWRAGAGPGPVTLAEGDTLRVRGAAFDSAGVASVTVDGRTAAEADPPEETLAFGVALVGRAAAGTRTVIITVSTVDGREIRREYTIIQLPGGTP